MQETPKNSRFSLKKMVLICTSALIIISVIVSGLFFVNHSASPVPNNIQKAVNFPIYYPEQKKLPAGYNLDKSSFSNPRKNGAAYIITYANNQRIVFAAQPKQSDDEMNLFYKSFLPLRSEVKTPVGTAEVGAYNNKGKLSTLVSLPIDNTNAWLVITAPADIDQNNLKQVLDSLKK